MYAADLREVGWRDDWRVCIDDWINGEIVIRDGICVFIREIGPTDQISVLMRSLEKLLDEMNKGEKYLWFSARRWYEYRYGSILEYGLLPKRLMANSESYAVRACVCRWINSGIDILNLWFEMNLGSESEVEYVSFYNTDWKNWGLKNKRFLLNK